MIPTDYSISVKDAVLPEIPNGLYYDIYQNTACEFRGGKGLEKNLTDGTETAFTYQQTEPGIWEFRTADGVNRYRWDSCLYTEAGCIRGFFTLESETESYRLYNYLNPLSFEAYPAYTDAQVNEYGLAAYKNQTGKKVTSVETDYSPGGEMILNFYDGKTLVDSLYADHFGLMTTEDGSKQYYYALPHYRRCDLNGDKVISIADAVMTIRLITEEAPEQMPSQSAMDAADLNNDGVLTILDTSLLLDMLMRMDDFVA